MLSILIYADAKLNINMTSFSAAIFERRRLLLLTSLAAMLVLPACQDKGQASPLQFKGLDLTGAKYGRGFELRDADGKARNLTEFRGKVVLLNFGFTQCPDVCPTALTRAVAIRELLGQDADKVEVVFITIDPERDTPTVLKAYMAAFDKRFIGLSGDVEATKKVAQEFKVYFGKVPTGNSYTMDHSTFTYLFDPQGRLRIALRHEQSVQEHANDIKILLSGK
jgi:protein SCO1